MDLKILVMIMTIMISIPITGANEFDIIDYELRTGREVIDYSDGHTLYMIEGREVKMSLNMIDHNLGNGQHTAIIGEEVIKDTDGLFKRIEEAENFIESVSIKYKEVEPDYEMEFLRINSTYIEISLFSKKNKGTLKWCIGDNCSMKEIETKNKAEIIGLYINDTLKYTYKFGGNSTIATITVDGTNSGYIYDNPAVGCNGVGQYYVGPTNYGFAVGNGDDTWGAQYRSFLDFNLSEVDGYTITNATLYMYLEYNLVDPGDEAIVYQCDFDTLAVDDYSIAVSTEEGTIWDSSSSTSAYSSLDMNLTYLQDQATAQYCIKPDFSCADEQRYWYTAANLKPAKLNITYEVPHTYTLNITDPITSNPEEVSDGDNITVTFEFLDNGANITSGVSISNITIGNLTATIIQSNSCTGTLNCSAYDNETACNSCSQCNWTEGGGSGVSFFDTFENGNNWTETGDCGPYWDYDSSTTSGGTGPQNGDSDDTGDNFVYMETSSGSCDGAPDWGYLMYNYAIDWDAGENDVIKFETNFHGDVTDIGKLTVEENSTGSWVDMGFIEEDPDGNNGLAWTPHEIDASGLTGTGYIRFNYSDCYTYLGDAAIDKFNITSYGSSEGCYAIDGGSCSGCTEDNCSNCSEADCSIEATDELEWIAGKGWQVNITVPSGLSGLQDLFVNATYSVYERNETETEAINYSTEEDTEANWEFVTPTPENESTIYEDYTIINVSSEGLTSCILEINPDEEESTLVQAQGMEVYDTNQSDNEHTRVGRYQEPTGPTYARVIKMFNLSAISQNFTSAILYWQVGRDVNASTGFEINWSTRENTTITWDDCKPPYLGGNPILCFNETYGTHLSTENMTGLIWPEWRNFTILEEINRDISNISDSLFHAFARSNRENSTNTTDSAYISNGAYGEEEKTYINYTQYKNNITMTISEDGSYCYHNYSQLMDTDIYFRVYIEDDNENTNTTEQRKVTFSTESEPQYNYTYSGSGNWNINCSENGYINVSTIIDGSEVIFNYAGSVVILGNVTNVSTYRKHPDCTVYKHPNARMEVI